MNVMHNTSMYAIQSLNSTLSSDRGGVDPEFDVAVDQKMFVPRGTYYWVKEDRYQHKNSGEMGSTKTYECIEMVDVEKGDVISIYEPITKTLKPTKYYVDITTLTRRQSQDGLYLEIQYKLIDIYDFSNILLIENTGVFLCRYNPTRKEEMLIIPLTA